MNTVQSLAAILGLGFASGVNLYLGALVTGLAIRFHLVAGLPPGLDILAHPAVLAVSGLLFALEFFADKIPVVASVWDFVHTLIRPVGGALLALGAAGHMSPGMQTLAALAGGTLALGSHSAKMGLRLAAHVAPEPATFTAISTAEDVGVTGLLVLAFTHPVPALIILAVLILAIALLLPALGRVLRFMLRALGGRLRSFFTLAERDELPAWAADAIHPLDPEARGAVVQGFAWTLKGVPRLREGFLVGARAEWHFVCKRWGKVRTFHLVTDLPQAYRRERGFLYDTAVFLAAAKPIRFLVTKDWAPRLPDASR
ncbi:MAG TPA: DUF4126 domain-containing protein [Holophagaceae bacterium]|nr:DUF4126 domain-containing protein [Holophagaceae bacterium]